MSALRTVYRYWMSLLALAVVVQIGLAGYGAFNAAEKVSDNPINEEMFEDGFGAHGALGFFILVGVLLAVIIALLARPGKRPVWLTVVALGLMILQFVLAGIGTDAPAIGALHPVNAVVILALLGSLAAGEWRASKMGMTSQAAPAPPAP